MGSGRRYLVRLLLYVSIVNQSRLPMTMCQEEEGNQCLPKKAFFALLRLPEVSSNLAAYSRTARILQGARSRDDFVHLKGLNLEDGGGGGGNNGQYGDDTEICIPAGVYLELFRDPAMRGHLSALNRAQMMMESSDRSFDEDTFIDPEELGKRSISTLAKNGDLPIIIPKPEEDEEDGEKRSLISMYEDGNMNNEDLRVPTDEELSWIIPGGVREYVHPIHEINWESVPRAYYYQDKRNLGSLARDYALPSGKKLGASSFDYFSSNGKRNVGTLARDHALPMGTGKRNVASLAKMYQLPQNGKRNIASLRQDFLRYGKRYLGSVARYGLPGQTDEEKRNVASLARNTDYPRIVVRRDNDHFPPAGSLIARLIKPHQRLSRSVNYETPKDENLDQGTKIESGKNVLKNSSIKKNESQNIFHRGERRSKRQIEFFDEYSLPVLQNTDSFDYDDAIGALNGNYPITEKRFMDPEKEFRVDLVPMDYLLRYPPRRIPQMGPRLTTSASRRLGRYKTEPQYEEPLSSVLTRGLSTRLQEVPAATDRR